MDDGINDGITETRNHGNRQVLRSTKSSKKKKYINKIPDFNAVGGT